MEDLFCTSTAIPGLSICLLYTSDAADDLLCVDLGGRRVIKKKNKKQKQKKGVLHYMHNNLTSHIYDNNDLSYY